MALFFDSEAKKKKQQIIELQNIILDIDEKKLQVSEEFLAKMVKIYISRYMKQVNEHLTEMGKAPNIALLFRHYDIIGNNLEMLIKIEPYHKFKKPAPSEYKAQLEEKLDEYINSLIAREWRKIKPSNSGVIMDDPALEKKVRNFFATFTSYGSRMPQSSRDLLKKIYDSAFPSEAENKENDISSTPNEQSPAEGSDGFVEEVFEKIDPNDTVPKE